MYPHDSEVHLFLLLDDKWSLERCRTRGFGVLLKSQLGREGSENVKSLVLVVIENKSSSNTGFAHIFQFYKFTPVAIKHVYC